MRYFLIIALMIVSVIQAETVDQIYHTEVGGKEWGIVRLDTGEFFVVNCTSGPIVNAHTYVFETLGNFNSWKVGDYVTYGELSNARGGFGWNAGGTYPVLNHHKRGEYIVLGHKYGRGWDTDHFFEDKVREINGNELITEGQLRLAMPEALARWEKTGSHWEIGDTLVIFALRAFSNRKQEMIQPHAIINPLRNDIETNFQATRAFFPFNNNVLTYTVVKVQAGQNNSSKPCTVVTLNDGSVWKENRYSEIESYNGIPNLKVGDEIVLRQYDFYHWRGQGHEISSFLSFSAIRVDTGEEIELFDLGDEKRRPTGQSWQKIGSNLQLLIGDNTLVEVADEASYKKVLSWGPKAKVTIAMANHGEGYILLNLTSFQRTFWPTYWKAKDHWVELTGVTRL